MLSFFHFVVVVVFEDNEKFVFFVSIFYKGYMNLYNGFRFLNIFILVFFSLLDILDPHVTM